MEERTSSAMEGLWLVHGDNESDGRAGTVVVINLRNKKLEFMSECVAYAAMRGGIEAGVRSLFLICGGEPEVGLTWPLLSLLVEVQLRAHTHTHTITTAITCFILFHVIISIDQPPTCGNPEA